VALWPDSGTLVVGDAKGKYLWAFRIEKDGVLTAGESYYPLLMKAGDKESHVSALTVDDTGRVYACTPLGIQVFDPAGRLSGVLTKPADGEIRGIMFGGGELSHTLIVAFSDALYGRKMQARGVSWSKPKGEK
jgi:enterochelin esterase family protein